MQVFYAEYFGPLFIHPLLYYFPEVFYPGVPNEKPKHLIQTVALVCVLVHYLKRELETMFVHHFSNVRPRFWLGHA
jgi:very-long-chain enoyl-CoA reductase